MRLVNQMTFSGLTGLTKNEVHQLTKSDLVNAMVGSKIDRDHPDAKLWIKAPPPPPPSSPALMNNTVPPTDYLEGTEIEGLGDMTLREIANKYGTVAVFVDWLNARKKVVDIGEKEIKNAKLRGELVPRDFIENFIIQQFERTNMNLLNDAPKTIAAELISLIKAGGTLEDAEISVERVLSTHLKAGKDYVTRMIERA